MFILIALDTEEHFKIAKIEKPKNFITYAVEINLKFVFVSVPKN